MTAEEMMNMSGDEFVERIKKDSQARTENPNFELEMFADVLPKSVKLSYDAEKDQWVATSYLFNKDVRVSRTYGYKGEHHLTPTIVLEHIFEEIYRYGESRGISWIASRVASALGLKGYLPEDFVRKD